MMFDREGETESSKVTTIKAGGQVSEFVETPQNFVGGMQVNCNGHVLPTAVIQDQQNGFPTPLSLSEVEETSGGMATATPAATSCPC